LPSVLVGPPLKCNSGGPARATRIAPASGQAASGLQAGRARDRLSSRADGTGWLPLAGFHRVNKCSDSEQNNHHDPPSQMLTRCDTPSERAVQRACSLQPSQVLCAPVGALRSCRQLKTRASTYPYMPSVVYTLSLFAAIKNFEPRLCIALICGHLAQVRQSRQV